MATYDLYYHPGFGGRALAARMLMADAGVTFNLLPVIHDGKDKVVGENCGCPVFAPPVLKKGDFVLSQSGVIVHYLGTQHGYVPSTPEGSAQCMQLIEDSSDIAAEGFRAKSGPDGGEAFAAPGGRLSSWLTHMSKVLEKHASGDGYLLGAVSAADFQFLSTLVQCDWCLGEENMAALLPENLKTWKATMMARRGPTEWAALNEPALFPKLKYVPK